MTTRKRNEAAFLALLVLVIAAILLYENSGSPQQTGRNFTGHAVPADFP